MTVRYYMGLDMGGTNLRCAAVSTGGDVLLMRRAAAVTGDSADRIVANIADQLRALETAAQRAGLGAARGVGVAVPGPLELPAGIVVVAPHVAAWRLFPLKRRLEQKLGRPVTIENDANAWALGESWRGVARGRRHVVLLTLGTGVGGGLIVEGKLVRGASGMAGELGHLKVEAGGLRCDCGGRGCLEAYTSASGLRRLIERRLGLSFNAPLPLRLLDEQGGFSGRHLANLARRGHPLARSIFAEAGRYLGIAIASLINIFNPEMVVLGGGLSQTLALMRQAMLRAVREQAFPAATAQARIVRARLGERAGVVGAAYAAMRPI